MLKTFYYLALKDNKSLASGYVKAASMRAARVKIDAAVSGLAYSDLYVDLIA
jgi:hypothetical protein